MHFYLKILLSQFTHLFRRFCLTEFSEEKKTEFSEEKTEFSERKKNWKAQSADFIALECMDGRQLKCNAVLIFFLLNQFLRIAGPSAILKRLKENEKATGGQDGSLL